MDWCLSASESGDASGAAKALDAPIVSAVEIEVKRPVPVSWRHLRGPQPRHRGGPFWSEVLAQNLSTAPGLPWVNRAISHFLTLCTTGHWCTFLLSRTASNFGKSVLFQELNYESQTIVIGGVGGWGE